MNNEIITARDPEIVAAEIRLIRDQAGQMLLTAAIQIGQRLNEAKSMVPHGEWGEWLKASVNYSQSTANNMMRLAAEYGDNQASLFEKVAKSQTFGNLTYTKALALLDVPEEAREAFVEENDVEGMSTRELKQTIKDLQAQLEDQKAAGKKALDLMSSQSRENGQKYNEAKDLLQEAQKECDRLTGETNTLREGLAASERQTDKILAQLKEAREHPEIPENQMKAIQKEAEAAATSKQAKQYEKKLKAAEEAKKAAEEAMKEAQAAADTAKKQAQAAEEKAAATAQTAKMASPAVAVFQEAFSQSQLVFGRLVELWKKMQSTDPESAACCHQALEALVEKLRGDIS